MTYKVITEADRKYHFWRGFRTASIIYVPIIVVLLLACNEAINLLIK